jgi:hypothetical protein
MNMLATQCSSPRATKAEIGNQIATILPGRSFALGEGRGRGEDHGRGRVGKSCLGVYLWLLTRGRRERARVGGTALPTTTKL